MSELKEQARRFIETKTSFRLKYGRYSTVYRYDKVHDDWTISTNYKIAKKDFVDCLSVEEFIGHNDRSWAITTMHYFSEDRDHTKGMRVGVHYVVREPLRPEEEQTHYEVTEVKESKKMSKKKEVC